MAKKFKLPVIPVLWVFLSWLLIWGLASTASAEPLDIVGKDVELTLDVEVADTAEKRRIGLMKRTELQPLSGMLFDFQVNQPVNMWMKNTLIPLDMIFADDAGRIVYIKEQAQPGDLSVVSSKIPVLAVLEMAGGFVSRYKIQKGDMLIHAVFDK